ncbi:transcription antitermination factor NusB [Candidatus Dependentiae bacterium]|nr:MAG: transcription antitermination factor NusB [Candidatus Dependentiae bacterium]
MKEDHVETVVNEEEEWNYLGELAAGTVAYNDLSRRDVRSLIFYLLYASESFDYQESLDAIVDNFNRGFDIDIPVDSEVVKVAQSVIDERDALDDQYKPLLSNWRFDRVGVSTKLILRFATWELLHTDTDSRIVINEAVELAKRFAEKDAYKFVNGILDRLIKELDRDKGAEAE